MKSNKAKECRKRAGMSGPFYRFIRSGVFEKLLHRVS